MCVLKRHVNNKYSVPERRILGQTWQPGRHSKRAKQKTTHHGNTSHITVVFTY